MAKKSRTKTQPTESPKKPKPGDVDIRMYRQGLGDCFLLTFHAEAPAKPVRVLIDCGVLMRTDQEGEKLLSVVDDLVTLTGGRIDLLIVTHEHWDHVAGFSYAHERLKAGDLVFDRVWLSWAENLSDPLARTLYDDLSKKKQTARKALQLAALMGLPGAREDDNATEAENDDATEAENHEARQAKNRLDAEAESDEDAAAESDEAVSDEDAEAENVAPEEETDEAARRLHDQLKVSRSILGFLGPEQADGPALGVAGNKPRKHLTLGETMDWIRARVQPGDFCEPGECRDLPGADGVKVFVLGPPRDKALIKLMDVRGEQGFELAADRFGLLGMDIDERIRTIERSLAGTANPTEPEPEPRRGTPPNRSPFEPRFQIPLERARREPFFRTRYGFDGDPLASTEEAWRRIDDAWLVGGISQLALQIDKQTNNSSLAVAFQLPDGRTLIFPGDAQFGNWISWDSVTFRDANKTRLKITTEDLLRRAVFYKVGHHGSHNATRRESLKKMTSGNLVAMIPTDEAFALEQNPKGSWQMPKASLDEMLQELTRKRVIRADRLKTDLPAEFQDEVHFTEKPLLPDLEPKTHPLWVEYRISAPKT